MTYLSSTTWQFYPEIVGLWGFRSGAETFSEYERSTWCLNVGVTDNRLLR